MKPIPKQINGINFTVQGFSTLDEAQRSAGSLDSLLNLINQAAYVQRAAAQANELLSQAAAQVTGIAKLPEQTEAKHIEQVVNVDNKAAVQAKFNEQLTKEPLVLSLAPSVKLGPTPSKVWMDNAAEFVRLGKSVEKLNQVAKLYSIPPFVPFAGRPLTSKENQVRLAQTLKAISQAQDKAKLNQF